MSITEYIKETKAEFSHVSWPTRKQSIAFTAVVVALAIATGIYLGLFDTIFSLGLRNLI